MLAQPPIVPLPESLDDVRSLVTNRVRESLTLDYKASAAINDRTIRTEVPKDVSAFANSEGGVIVYGVEEENEEPVRIDRGVDTKRFRREGLEQCILSGIRPAVPALLINEIPLSPGRSLFAVAVPKSYRTPHQAPDRRYYRRYNFTSVQLEDYEITDLRGRGAVVPALIHVDLRIRGGVLVEIVVENVGEHTAADVTFEFPPSLKWIDGTVPLALTRPMKAVPRGRRLVYLYQTTHELMKPNTEQVPEFDVVVSYTHPLTGSRTRDEFHLNVLDYFGSQMEQTELQKLGEALGKRLERVADELSKLNQALAPLTHMVDATGLSLSVPTLKNLRRVLRGDDGLEPLDPQSVPWSAFREVLGVDYELAHRLHRYFRYGRPEGKRLEEVQGLTEELRSALGRQFKLEP